MSVLSGDQSIEALDVQEDVMRTLEEWLEDPASSRNSMVVLIAGIIYTNEGDSVTALKALHGGDTLEMCQHPPQPPLACSF